LSSNIDQLDADKAGRLRGLGASREFLKGQWVRRVGTRLVYRVRRDEDPKDKGNIHLELLDGVYVMSMGPRSCLARPAPSETPSYPDNVALDGAGAKYEADHY
jgi:hypothetical protein